MPRPWSRSGPRCGALASAPQRRARERSQAREPLRQVAELAAEGHGNREIAQVLFVTPRTIESHLTSVYRKLGISARAGLSDVLEPCAPA